jgi:hypothetical protein
MCTFNRMVQIASIVIATAMFAGPSHAQNTAVSDWGTLVSLQAGWVVDRMLVFHSAPIRNPGACSVLNNGYIINETDGGRSTFYAFLMSALLNKREVQFVVSGCFENRPRIVSVSIR